MQDRIDFLINNAEILSSSEQNDTIDSDAMVRIVEMAKKQKVLNVHPRSIHRLPDGRFQTYIKLSDGKQSSFERIYGKSLSMNLRFSVISW